MVSRSKEPLALSNLNLSLIRFLDSEDMVLSSQTLN